MSTLTNPPFQVGITFENAQLNLSGDTLENQLNSKAEKTHKHDLSDGTIIDASGKLDNLTNNCIKTESGNATISGYFNCKDIRFYLNNQQTLLSDKMKELDEMNSMTVQHLTLTADPNIRVGYPVFFTGEIIGKNYTPITISSTDCVPIVKADGDWNTFAGICTEVDAPYYGKTKQKYKGKEHVYIRFATHGDFQMAVDDNSKYKIGDLVKYDGEIVNPEDPIDYKTMMSIVGSVTALVENNSIAVFRI